MAWNDKRVEILKKMWLEGMSASHIAGELANGITRNAVIGKVHRLGLSGRVKAPSPMQSRPRPQARAHRNIAPKIRKETIKRDDFEDETKFKKSLSEKKEKIRLNFQEQQTKMEILPPKCQPVDIMELKEKMCRWPLGNPTQEDFRYCGSRTSARTSYCEFHQGISH